ncbi:MULTISPECIES: GNAT family N-acetyltransferase [Paenibacillus]|uniref:GNAT family N-acetyltransferase n=1 Tax=Paenibacillus TaxID=44249 RepID=UPI0022B86538|nr:GNAT family N-acetyltransferase [Paenibacillus caseinilyticus]MCZ8523919.1 GNAT family N-acetyltransferase [Paenibacillus caseinilyticus]
MSVSIRRAAREDVSDITGLMYEYIVGFYQNPWPGQETIQALAERLLKEEAGVQFVAEQEGRLIGFATLYFSMSTMKAKPITVMNDLFVREPYREAEAESLLFAACRDYTIEQGYASMTWITAPGNVRAQQRFDEWGGRRGNWVSYSIP